MCDQCKQLEVKIQRYRSFVAQGFDALTRRAYQWTDLGIATAKEVMRCSASAETRS
jgi:hypothetical protein